MDEKIEYTCECGRHFIVVGRSEKRVRKCPHCARIMYPKGDHIAVSQPQAKEKKVKNPLDIDDTLEYEYTFDEKGERTPQGKEPSTWKRFFKKIFTLFSIGGSGPTYRDY